MYRPAFFAAWLVVSLAPWLSLPLASADDGFGVREVAATTVGVLIALGLLVAVAGSSISKSSDTFDRLLILSSLTAGVTAIPAAFAGALYRLSASSPDAFSDPLSKVDALYLSVITFTTTGFRDLQPESSSARLLVVFELISTFVVVVVAVALVVRRVRPRSAPAPDGTD